MRRTTQIPTPTTDAAGGTDVDQIPAAAWNAGGALGMLIGLYWALVKGWLYTGASHREIVADKDKRIDVQDKTIDSLTESVRMYAVSADTTAHAIHEIEKLSAKKDQS